MRLIQAKPSQCLPRDGLHKADEAALCATSCCLWDPHFGAMMFCPWVPSHSRRKSSCALSVLTHPNLASVIVAEQLLDAHGGEWNNLDVPALSPHLAPWPDFMEVWGGGHQESRNSLGGGAAAAMPRSAPAMPADTSSCCTICGDQQQISKYSLNWSNQDKGFKSAKGQQVRLHQHTCCI